MLRWFGTNADIHERKQTLQEVFLPERLPSTPDLSLDAAYVPAISDALVVSIGDVAGHGLDAAVVAGRLRQTIFLGSVAHERTSSCKTSIASYAPQSETVATALVAYYRRGAEPHDLRIGRRAS